jgi:hypothetical protein
MQSTLRLSTTVLPGGRIEISDPQLPSGEAVDLIVLLPPAKSGSARSIVDVLREAPGHLVFQSAEEVEHYLREGRDAWER